MNGGGILYSMGENILITGGSGFIGYHLNRVLDSSKIINLDLLTPKFKTDAKYLWGDVCNTSDVLKASAGCNAIIHLAAAHRDFGITDREFHDVNVGSAKNVAESAIKSNIRKIIYLSTVAVYGDNYKTISEGSEPKPISAYGSSKLRGEQVFIKWAEDNKNNRLAIIRPTVVHGPENYANMYNLINQINSWKYFHIGKEKNIKSIAYVENLVEMIIFLMNSMMPGVKIYNYSDEPHLTSREISNIIIKALGRKRALTMPYSVAYLVGRIFDIISKIAGRNLQISTKRIKKFCAETYYDAPEVKKIGFERKYTNEEGLKKMVDWYINMTKK